MVKVRQRARVRKTVSAVRLSDEDVELVRDLYEAGRQMSEVERRRRQLGYKGLAKRFGVHPSTIRWYVNYLRRTHTGCTGW